MDVGSKSFSSHHQNQNSKRILFTGKPPSVNIWLIQCILYIGLMGVVKTCITLFMHLDFWDGVKNFILSPINNAKVERAFVILIIPFFVNVSIRFS